MKTMKWNKRENTPSFGKIFPLAALAAVPHLIFAGGDPYPDLVSDPNPSNHAAVNSEGLLDVTKSPYNLNNTSGNASSNTSSLQDAIDYAFANNLAVFFPEGTYAINDTLELFMERIDSGPNTSKDEMTFNHHLLGSALGSRPVIKLSAGSGDGFNSTSNPKALFYYKAMEKTTGQWDHSKEQPGDAYNMVFRGIDIDLASSGYNDGAIGIDMHAAQGSTIQDSTIDATGAFAGIQSLCGSGAYHANIRVDGGKYGIYVNQNRPSATLVGITLIDQTTRPIHFSSNLIGPLTIVGFRIESDVTNVFDLSGSRDDEHLSLIDGSIEMTGSAKNVIKNANRSVYARNVYVKNANKVVDNSQGTDVTDNGSSTNGWVLLEDYNYYNNGLNRQMDNGVASAGEYGTYDKTIAAPSSELLDDLINRHLWDESTFPHFELPTNQRILISQPNGGGTDDTADINQAILDAEAAGHNTVLLGRGDYILYDTVELQKHTKLVGLARNLTRLHADPSKWNNGSNYVPLVKTQNDKDSTCLLAWISLEMPNDDDESDRITWLEWEAGRHSMAREVHFRKDSAWNPPTQYPTKRLVIKNNGGGRWYGLWTRAATEQGEDDDHRNVYASGTREPLWFYAFGIEYQESEVYMTEINDCQNVCFYGFKIETDANDGDDGGIYKRTPALGIVNCKNVFIAGEAGKGELDTNETTHGLFEIVGSSSGYDDIQLVNIAGNWGTVTHYQTNFGLIRDMDEGDVLLRTEPASNPEWGGEVAAMFLVGDSPSPIAYSPPTGGGGSGENLVVNPGFEDATLMNGYTGSGVVGYGSNAHTGNQVGKLTSSSSWKSIEQVVNDLAANTDYAMSGFLRRVGPNSGNSKFQIVWRDSSNQNIRTDILVTHTGPVTTWTEYSNEYESPAGTDNAKIQIISTSGIGTGVTIWVDDLSLAEVGASGTNHTMKSYSTSHYPRTDGTVNDIVMGDTPDNNNEWEFVLVSGNEYRIRKPGTTYYLKLPSTGDNCTMSDGVGGDDRIWIITEYNTTGRYNIKNKGRSDRYLYCSNGGTPAEVVRALTHPDWGDAQWTFSPAIPGL